MIRISIKILTIFALLFICTQLNASLPLEVPMLEVVDNSDHLLSITVTNIEMYDDNKQLITDGNATTGPGSANTIYLVCSIKHVYVSNREAPSGNIRIPLDKNMHYSLDQIKHAHAQNKMDLLVVLRGDDYQPAFPGIFNYPNYELKTLLKLFELKMSTH